MNYNTLLELATQIGYKLAMCGAETFRVEESITRILSAYGVEAEVFAITNCLTVSIHTSNSESITKMKRIGYHGNDLDAVERYSNLSRKICSQCPDPETGLAWIKEVEASRIYYSLPLYVFGHALGASGFAVMFGGTFPDSLCAGLCGILAGLANYFFDGVKVNPFFRTIAVSFLMCIPAYALEQAGISNNTACVIIGALMILVPGLLFTNAMRDIIYGDTNSGMNRIIQVLLTAAAIALGTGAAWSISQKLWGVSVSPLPIDHPIFIQLLAAFIGCTGFFICFNIHGYGGFLCALGGALTWGTYLLATRLGASVVLANFCGGLVAASYAELMARIRKYPAISYLVISLFPLIPGAGVYYSTNYLVQGEMDMFAKQAINTIAIAGALAVGVLIVSSIVRVIGMVKNKKAS